jgi:hypothetical protein
LVLASAVWALLTLAWALYTAACAEASVAAGLVELLELLEPLDPLELGAEPEPAEGVVPDVLGAVVVGAAVAGLVVVVVGAGVVVVGLVVVVVGPVVVLETNCAVPAVGVVLRLAVVVVEPALD